MGGVEGLRDLGDDRERLRGLEPPSPASSAEVGAVDVAHGDVQHAVGLAGFVDRDDVRVVERGGERATRA